LKKLKILYVTSGNIFDNSHRKLLSIIRNISNEKYEFSIVCGENLLLLAYLKSFDVPVYVLNLPGRISSKYSNLLNKLQIGENFDIVQSFDYVSGIYSRLLKKFNPELKCIHSPESLMAIEHKSVFTKQLVKSTMQYYSMFTDRIICENEYAKRISVRNKYLDEDKIIVIPASVNISRFANLKKNFDIKSELGFDKDNFIIGSLSGFDENNNQQVIIRAAYYLVRKYPQLRFLFVGDGKKLRSMQDLVSQSNLNDYCVFAFEKENIDDYYSLMDMFILADKWGGPAFVLLEAMASKLPIVCSTSAEYLPFSKNNQSLIPFDPNDMDDLFENVDYLYQNKQRRETLAQNAMIEATQFDETEIVPKFESVYLEVMKN
jgi:glycosyltransferase involved in cell wall biosynthesis